MIIYLVQALTWSMFGLAVGWFVCHAEVELVNQIREVKMTVGSAGESGKTGYPGGPGGVGGEGGEGGTGESGGGTGGVGGVGGTGGEGGAGSGHSAEHSSRSSRFVGVFLILMALAVGLSTWYSTNQDRKASEREAARSECQAQYNADFAQVLRLRSTWTEEDKAAQVTLFRDFLTVTQEGQGRVLLEQFLATTARTDKLRAQNPLPKLEDRNC